MVDIEGRLQHLVSALVKAREGLGIGTRHPGGGVAQPFPVGILADGDEQLADRSLRAGVVDRHTGQMSCGPTDCPGGTWAISVTGSSANGDAPATAA